MPLTDLPIDELERLDPDIPVPDDLVAFWTTTISEARAVGTAPSMSGVATPLATVEIADLVFPGWGGEPVHAWITRPRGATGALPTIVEYRGYGAGRGLPGDLLHWASAGYVHVLMDTRGQGGGWAYPGDTSDPHGSAPSAPGFLTRGIGDPSTYYYRRVYTDAVRLLDAVRQMPFVDPTRIAVAGISQGGGLALAAAGLDAIVPTGAPRLAAVLPELPFLCWFRRSIDLTPSGPVTEFAHYLSINRDAVDTVLQTLSYFDAATLGMGSAAPAHFAVALMDDIVLPSTVYAAFNRYGRRSGATPDRQLVVYPYNGHEGGQHRHWLRQAEWLAPRMR